MTVSPGPYGNFAAHLLRDKAGQWPERIAVRCQGRAWTYAELSAHSRAMAARLRARGLAPGDRVFIVLPDSLSFLAAFLGSLLAGFVVVPVSDRLRQADYADGLNACAPVLVLTQDGHEVLDAAAAAGIPALFLDDASLPAPGPDLPAPDVHPGRAEDICALFITSGTTGRPKVIPHRQADFFAVAESTGTFLGLGPSDVVLASAKMCHCYGLLSSLICPLMAGAATVLNPDKPEAGNTLRLLDQERVSVFMSVPALYAMILLADPDRMRLGGLRLCVSAGEGLPKAIHAAWRELTGLEIQDGYGSSEAMTIVIGANPHRPTPGAAGYVIAPYEARILGPDGHPVPDGTPGQLAVRGPTVMPGYLNDPERTDRVLRPDGWLLTGDMAVLQDDVYTILGRLDDMFKAGGLWISPTRVENAFLSHPAVAQCAVTSGQAGAFSLVSAHVTLKPGYRPGPELVGELRAHAARDLPDFMVPAEVRFLPALPLTATGKIQRFKLKTPDHPESA